MYPLRSERLELVPGTLELLRAALAGAAPLGDALHARVAAGWPPDLLERAALEHTLAGLERGAWTPEWALHFVLRRSRDGERELIGVVAYKGPPAQDGSVEIGYGVVAEHQRCGYASEASQVLVERAFALPEVTCVVAETLPHLAASLGVMRRCGMRHLGAGSEPGVVRWGISRQEHLARRTR